MALRHGVIPGTDLDVSWLCYGVMQFNARVTGEAMYELYHSYREAGGNFFDTAHCYTSWMPTGGAGASERGLGDCMARYGDRGRIVVATKDGHPDLGPRYRRPDNHLAPEVIRSDVADSLERLRVDRIDLYLLHRDDPRRSVASIMDALNDQVARGRIRYLDASNSTVARIEEANAYAAAHGIARFAIAQQQWSLAHSNLPYPPNAYGPDPTCHRLNGDDIAWHRATGFPVMAYTATGFGYFGETPGRSAATCDNPVSRGRRDRTRQLGRQLGCSASQVALAYLGAHGFPAYPVLGTMNPAHLADALGADRITLAPEQRDWLRDGQAASSADIPLTPR